MTSRNDTETKLYRSEQTADSDRFHKQTEKHKKVEEVEAAEKPEWTESAFVFEDNKLRYSEDLKIEKVISRTERST